jgi:hypothetical protein
MWQFWHVVIVAKEKLQKGMTAYHPHDDISWQQLQINIKEEEEEEEERG